MIDQTEDTRSTTVTGTVDRDAGKLYRINEVSPHAMAGMVLRLLAALRLDDQSQLRELFEQPEDKFVLIETLLRLLSGCDPDKVHGLITDALGYVEVAPDPRHPGAFRRLDIASDIRELATLQDVLGAFVQLHSRR